MHFKTAHAIRDMLRKKEMSSVEVTEGILNRINSMDVKLGAFLEVYAESALELAMAADKRRLAGESLPDLSGIPMAIKDNICMRGTHTTCASKMLENYVAPYDAAVVEGLRENGAVILGKLNMDEFAMGSSNENSAFKKTRNPYDLERVPGGSSGGAAAAVAAGEAFYALGSDTGGSVRQPAALCGVVGMKPTYGRVSRYGLVAFASSLDQIGPITRDVEDCALVMNVISGRDERDSTSAHLEAGDFTKYLSNDLRGLRVGMPEEYFKEGLEDCISEKILEAVKVLEEQGALIKKIKLPMLEYSLAAYYIISSCEASSNLARYDGIRYGLRASEFENAEDVYFKSRSRGFGDEVRRRIMLGTYALSAGYYDAYYKKALKVKTLIIEEFKSAFKDVDIIISPASPNTAFKLGERTLNPLEMYMSDIYTVPVNIAGITAISVPAGFASGLPAGLQFIGNYFEEGTILKAAYAFEQAVKYNNPMHEGGQVWSMRL